MKTTYKDYHLETPSGKLAWAKGYDTAEGAIRAAMNEMENPTYYTPQELIVWLDREEESEDGYTWIHTKKAICRIIRDKGEIRTEYINKEELS